MPADRTERQHVNQLDAEVDRVLDSVLETCLDLGITARTFLAMLTDRLDDEEAFLATEAVARQRGIRTPDDVAVDLDAFAAAHKGTRQ